MNAFRIGHGYDVHRLTAGRKLILGGREVPFDRGLWGHSDADVLTHAVMDALLGAAGLGDIGKLFPDHDPTYAGISSRCCWTGSWSGLERPDTVWETWMLLWWPSSPNWPAFIPQMRQNLAKHLGVPQDQVNVKATTEEGLGFTGAGQGMAAHAVALLECN